MGPHRYLCHAIVAISTVVTPGKAVWGTELPNRKLDKQLQAAIAEGCSGGSERVIISVKSGYRTGMGDSLKAHGDNVEREFPSINAIAAQVHCDDLEPLAKMAEITSVSIDGPMEAHGPPLKKAKAPVAPLKNSKKMPAPTQAQAAEALQAPMFESTLSLPHLRAASYLGSPYTSTDTSLRNALSVLKESGLTGA